MTPTPDQLAEQAGAHIGGELLQHLLTARTQAEGLKLLHTALLDLDHPATAGGFAVVLVDVLMRGLRCKEVPAAPYLKLKTDMEAIAAAWRTDAVTARTASIPIQFGPDEADMVAELLLEAAQAIGDLTQGGAA